MPRTGHHCLAVALFLLLTTTIPVAGFITLNVTVSPVTSPRVLVHTTIGILKKAGHGDTANNSITPSASGNDTLMNGTIDLELALGPRSSIVGAQTISNTGVCTCRAANEVFKHIVQEDGVSLSDYSVFGAVGGDSNNVALCHKSAWYLRRFPYNTPAGGGGGEGKAPVSASVACGITLQVNISNPQTPGGDGGDHQQQESVGGKTAASSVSFEALTGAMCGDEVAQEQQKQEGEQQQHTQTPTIEGRSILSLITFGSDYAPKEEEGNDEPSPSSCCNKASLVSFFRKRFGTVVMASGKAQASVVSDGLAEFKEIVWPQLLPSAVKWSDMATLAATNALRPPAFVFNVHKVLVCGGWDLSTTVAVDGTVRSTGARVKVDWGQYHLTLPKELFEGLVVWANLTCIGDTTKPNACSLPSRNSTATTADGNQQHALSLAPLQLIIPNDLSQVQSANGFNNQESRAVELDLTPLIDVNNGTVAVASGPSLQDHFTEAVKASTLSNRRLVTLDAPFIVLGSSMLKTLDFIIDSEESRIGFATVATNKAGRQFTTSSVKAEQGGDSTESSNEGEAGSTAPTLAPSHNTSSWRGTCVLGAVCSGRVKYHVEQTNMCLDPSCSLLLLKRYDAKTNQCNTNTALVTLIAFFLVLVIVGEMAVHAINFEAVRLVDQKQKKA